jgi:hypothetical protein
MRCMRVQQRAASPISPELPKASWRVSATSVRAFEADVAEPCSKGIFSNYGTLG